MIDISEIKLGREYPLLFYFFNVDVLTANFYKVKTDIGLYHIIETPTNTFKVDNDTGFNIFHDLENQKESTGTMFYLDDIYFCHYLTNIKERFMNNGCEKINMKYESMYDFICSIK